MDLKYFFYFLIAVPFFGSAEALGFGVTVAKASNGFNVTFHFIETIVMAISNSSDDLQEGIVECLKESFKRDTTAIKKHFCLPLAKILIDMNKEGYKKISLAVQNEIKKGNPNIEFFFTAMELQGHLFENIANDANFYRELTAILKSFMDGFLIAAAGLNSITFRKLSDVALDEVQMAILRGFNSTGNLDQNTTPENKKVFPLMGNLAFCLLTSKTIQLGNDLFKALANEFKLNSTIKSKFFCPIGLTLSNLQKKFDTLSSDEINEIRMLPGINEFFELCGTIGNKYLKIVNEERDGEEIGEAITTTYEAIGKFLDASMNHPRTRLRQAILHELQDIIFNELENSQECPTLSVNIGLPQVPSVSSGSSTASQKTLKGVSGLSISL